MVPSSSNSTDSQASQLGLLSRDADREEIPTYVWVALAGGVLWAYWSTLTTMSDRWNADPLYAHGYLVPFVAAGIVWWRKDLLRNIAFEPDLLLGLPVLLGGIGLRLAAARLYLEWFDGLSLVPVVTGLVLLVGGRSLLKAVWPACVYLAFMVPLPFRLEHIASGPLQDVATKASTFALQLMGYPAGTEGNVITINSARIGVAEACSGLRMLVVFFATTACVALCLTKPIWERVVVLMSAVPIAVICNVTRITLTGVLFETVGSATAKLFFHDVAGWLMMVMAVGLLKLELWFWDRVMVERPASEVIPVSRPDLRPPISPTSTSAASTPSKSRREAAKSSLKQVPLEV